MKLMRFLLEGLSSKGMAEGESGVTVTHNPQLHLGSWNHGIVGVGRDL